jgi:hypothetical protein
MKTKKLGSVLFLMLAVALPAAGCGVSIEADVPEIEVTQRDLMFQGVPPAAAALVGEVSLSQKFSQKHKKLDLPKGLDSTVKALGVTLTAKSGVTDFSFIKNLRLTMTDDVHPAVTLVDYQQTPGSAPSNVLELVAGNPVNTLEQWKTDSATFSIDVAGTLPTVDWSVDLAIQFGGSFKYKP